MPRTISADGRTVTVPDDATPEEVNQIFGAPSNTPPKPLSGPIGQPPIPAQLQGGPRPANKGLGTGWDTLSEVGSHLKNPVAGPYHAFTDPATPEEEKEFNGQDLSGVGNHLSLGVKRMFVDPSVHNFQAGNAALKAGDINGALTNYAQSVPVAGPMEKQAVQTAQTKGALPALAGILTDLGVAKATGKLADTIAAPAQAGSSLQEAGLGRINRYLGAGVKDLKNGNNPARAVINEAPWVPLSRGSVARSIDTAAPKVGQQLSSTIQAADVNPNATPITKQSVAPSIAGPIAARSGEIMGPGGNSNVAPLQTLQDSFNEPAPGTSGPIAGPIAPATIAPTDLWKTIQNVDKNTNFSTDPEVEGVNEVRRDIRGGLRKNLESADPNIKPLSQRYADIKAAQNVLERKPSANSGATFSIPHMAGKVLNAAPIQVPLGRAVNTIGGAVSAVGRVLNPANTAGNIGDAAVVGSLGGLQEHPEPNDGRNDQEIQDGQGDGSQENQGSNLQDQHAPETTTPEEPEATPKALDRQTAEGYYDQAQGDPDGARELAIMDGYAPQ